MCAMPKNSLRAARRPEPVTVTFQPVVRCSICQQPIAHERKAGAAAAALTDHVSRLHQAGLPR
jgi:hypothetical protein